jgi:hypothetical protein
MTTPPDPKAAPAAAGAPATPDPAGRPSWAGDLKDEILGAVKELIAPLRQGGSAQQAAQQHEAEKLDRGSNLEQQIADAIKVNEEARAKDAAGKAQEDRLGKLEAAAAERPPVDRRRVHRFMGWGDPPQ